MKIAKRIDISYDPRSDDAPLSATLLVDTVQGTSGWILHIKTYGETYRVEASSSTVLALMMAERDFRSQVTHFYKVDES